jgi:VWFA-related protein
VLAVLALITLVADATSAQETRPMPAFPSRAEAITVDVVVLDNEGRPVRGLAKEDFTLLEDGRPQRIVGFQAKELVAPAKQSAPEVGVNDERIAANQGSSERRGRTFAFLVDDLGTEALPMEDAKRAIAGWLNDKADPRDEVTLTTTSGDAWWSDRVDRGRMDLLAVLSRVRGKKPRQPEFEWMSDWEAYRIAVYESPTDAGGESESIASGSAGGPPTSAGAGGPPAAGAAAGMPNALGRILDRVFSRWRNPTKTRQLVFARAMELYDALTRRIQSVLSAIERLSRGLAGTRGRKSIFVVSEGFLNDSHQIGFERAIDASQRGNTAVYFIDVRGLGGLSFYGAEKATAPAGADIGVITTEEAYLETAGTEYVAKTTGGTSVRDTNDLLGGLERVAAESSIYYLLGYQPENSPDGKWHKLEVKVSRRDVTVRSRRGYQATAPGVPATSPTATDTKKGDGKKGPSKGPTRPLDPAVMTGPADDTIALQVAPYVLAPDGTTLARVLVALEIHTSTLAFEADGGRRRATLDLGILGLSRDQPTLLPLDERLKIDMQGTAVGGWLSLSREIRLPAGVAQVRVLVRDMATGRAGTVTQRLVVPALDRPYLSTPILTDRIETPRGGPPRLVPLAHRRFRPKGRLYCAYEVFGMTDTEGRATTQVAGSHTLQTEEGRVISTSPLTRIAVDLGGRVVRMLALPLDGLDEGGYRLTVEVVDQASGRTLVTREAFVLERETRASKQ